MTDEEREALLEAIDTEIAWLWERYCNLLDGDHYLFEKMVATVLVDRAWARSLIKDPQGRPRGVHGA